MIRSVLDTNVLASGFIGEVKSDSAPGALIRYWRTKAYELVISEHILAELQTTFSAPYFTDRLTAAQISDALTSLRVDTVIPAITVQVAGVASHPEDDLVLATALSGQVGYLVTGDKRLRARRTYGGTHLLSPREFLDFLEPTLKRR